MWVANSIPTSTSRHSLVIVDSFRFAPVALHSNKDYAIELNKHFFARLCLTLKFGEL